MDELEAFCLRYASLSSEHRGILHVLQSCRGKAHTQVPLEDEHDEGIIDE